jgi:uncharacterized protein (DUF2062 family)
VSDAPAPEGAPAVHWVRRRIANPLLALLKQGVSPQRLALCVALGIVIGNMPIMGLSTGLCALIALVFRLNLPAMQLVQALMAPTQLLLIIPYVRLGEWILRAPRQPLSIEAGLALFTQGVGHAVFVLWDAIVHAGFAFLLVAPFATFALYRILVPVFAHAAARFPPRGAPLAT